MNVCVNDLSGSDMDIFYKLIIDQYREFIHFYRLVEDELENVSKLEYDATSETSLIIGLQFEDKKSMKAARNALEDKYERSREELGDNWRCNATFRDDKKELIIELTYT